VRDLWPDLPIAVGALKDPLSRWAAYRLEKFAYRNAARIVALSSGMAKGIARTGYPSERITVVPNGSDLALFARDAAAGAEFRRQHGIAPDAVVVGYVGTLGKINDVSYFARLAAALADEPRIRFLVVGDGLERAKVTELARTLGVLDRNFIMLDKMPKACMPQVLAALDIATSLCLPLPQLEANSANKFFDALAAGCCVAVNHGGWQPELLESTGCGLRLDTAPARAAQQVRDLARDPVRLQAMGRRARALAEASFSRDDLAAQLERVLNEAVAETMRDSR
jgi:glycosyltransferase involved in cell wall biosynthesis